MSGDMLKAFAIGRTAEFAQAAYEALLSPDRRPLDLLVDQARNSPDVSDAFRYGLESLQAYRDFYDERMAGLPPRQRSLVEQYDEEWTEELLRHAYHQIYGGPVLTSRESETVFEPDPE